MCNSWSFDGLRLKKRQDTALFLDVSGNWVEQRPGIGMFHTDLSRVRLVRLLRTAEAEESTGPSRLVGRPDGRGGVALQMDTTTPRHMSTYYSYSML